MKLESGSREHAAIKTDQSLPFGVVRGPIQWFQFFLPTHKVFDTANGPISRTSQSQEIEQLSQKQWLTIDPLRNFLPALAVQ